MIKERLDIFLSYLRLSGRGFEKECEFKTGVYSSIKEGTSASTFVKILNRYPQLSAEWLMRGEGEMLRKKEEVHETFMKRYEELVMENIELKSVAKKKWHLQTNKIEH